MFREYRVQHVSKDGILLQLPGNGGFGRVSLDTLGGDALGERLVKLLAGKEVLRAVPRRSRDGEGYRVMSLVLKDLWSGVLAYPQRVARLLDVLFRKHIGVGLGTVTRGTVVKVSDHGCVFTLVSGLVAATPREVPSSQPHLASASSTKAQARPLKRGRGASDGDEASTGRRVVEKDASAAGTKCDGDAPGPLQEKQLAEGTSLLLRVLDYNVDNGIVNVSWNPTTVQAAPPHTDPAALADLFSAVVPGQKVRARVLLTQTDDGCAVVDVVVDGCNGATVPGYYFTHGGAALPAVGEDVVGVVEFTPETVALQDILPVVVVSDRVEAFHAEPELRQAGSPLSLLGQLPWRTPRPWEAGAAMSSWDESTFFLADDGGDQAQCGPGVADGTSYKTQLRKRRLEEAIDAYERSADSQAPSTPEEFQRALLGAPNSSYLWTQYMAYHTSLRQFEEARQIAEKALATIGIRESKEHLNVWVAYMNLENHHGTPESLNAIFKRALQRSDDTLAVHERLADILRAARKFPQLLQLCRTMASKYRSEPRVWERLGVVLVESEKRDQLKRMIKEMGDHLKRDEQCLVVIHIAVHEYRRGGHVEAGRALFEGLVAKVPKKSDVWSAYLDQELALLSQNAPTASVSGVRTLFERAVAMKFSTKVMQAFLTRFLGFEKRFGTPSDVERVKDKAREYVESKVAAQAIS